MTLQGDQGDEQPDEITVPCSNCGDLHRNGADVQVPMCDDCFYEYLKGVAEA